MNSGANVVSMSPLGINCINSIHNPPYDIFQLNTGKGQINMPTRQAVFFVSILMLISVRSVLAYDVVGEEEYFRQIVDGQEIKEAELRQGSRLVYYYDVDLGKGTVTVKKSEHYVYGKSTGLDSDGWLSHPAVAKIEPNLEQDVIQAVGTSGSSIFVIAITPDFVNKVGIAGNGSIKVSCQKRIRS